MDQEARARLEAEVARVEAKLLLEKQNQPQAHMKNSVSSPFKFREIDTSTWVSCFGCDTLCDPQNIEEQGICRWCYSRRSDDIRKEHERIDHLIEILSPKGYRDYAFNKFQYSPENQAAFNSCMEFNPRKDNLYLWGNAGSGKTHLAYAIVRKYLEHQQIYGLRVKIFKTPDLMRQFRGIESWEETKLMNEIVDCDILLIDDLGVGRATEFANQILYEIIDKRIMNLRNGLIITSNLSLADFAAKVEDGRLPDRLAGICKFEQVSVKESWRVKNAIPLL